METFKDFGEKKSSFWKGSSQNPIAILRRINIRTIVSLDDMLLMGWTLQEIMTARDTLIFLLENLGFVISQSYTQ